MAETKLQNNAKGAVATAPNVPTQPQHQYKSALAKATETYTNMLIDTAKSIEIKYSDYQKICVSNAVAKMQELLVKEGVTFRDVDSSNITNTLQTIAMLQLNTAAVPRECYLQLRRVKVKVPTGEQDNYGNAKFKDGYIRQFEFGIEGDGNDAILRTYGVDINKVHNCWIIREGDEFTYPSFNGLELSPPKWSPKSYIGKVVRVVYPLQKNDGTIEYHIAEREGVVKNLLAHINNNMMNETFGIAENRYRATAKQLEEIENKKQELFKLLEGKSLDEILEVKEVRKWISPSWLAPHSREEMILRKLRNNAVKKIPKDFKNAFASLEYEKTYEDYEQYRGQAKQPQPDAEEQLTYEVENEANQEPLNTTVKLDDGKEENLEVIEKPHAQQASQTNSKPSKPDLFSAPF